MLVVVRFVVRRGGFGPAAFRSVECVTSLYYLGIYRLACEWP